MGFRRAFLHLNWPALVCGFFNVFSGFSLTILTKIAVGSLDFPFPATIALLHTGGVALMLWFWTLFGIFKPRQLALGATFRIAGPHAATAILSIAALRYTSLSVFQATRLAVSPTVFLLERALVSHFERHQSIRRRRRHPFETPLLKLMCAVTGIIFLAALVVVAMAATSSRKGVLIAIVSVAATAVVQIQTLPHLRQASVTELQLQLYTKTAAAFLVALACPFVDDYSPMSATSVINYPFQEHHTLLILLTALLAFLSFVSMRASASRATVTFFSVQSIAIAACIFAADWYLFGSHLEATRLWYANVSLLLISTAVFNCLRDAQIRPPKRGRTSDCEVDTSDDEGQPLRHERLDRQRLDVQQILERPVRQEGTASPLSATHRSSRAISRAVSLNNNLSPRQEIDVG